MKDTMCVAIVQPFDELVCEFLPKIRINLINVCGLGCGREDVKELGDA